MRGQDQFASFQPVKSVDRTLDVLEALASATDPTTLSDLTRALVIPKSSLHGIIRTLRQRGWVEVDRSGMRFRLGLRALQVGFSFVQADDGVQRAQPTLDWLAEQSGETVQLGRLDGSEVVYLAKRGSRHPLQLLSTVGTRLPAHATALGKVMLATRDPAEVRALLPDQLMSLTPRTIVSLPSLLDNLALTRDRGYAIDNEEAAEGIRCVAVTVRTAADLVDAISFSVPTFRLDAEHERDLVTLLRAGKERIEVGSLSAPGPPGRAPDLQAPHRARTSSPTLP